MKTLRIFISSPGDVAEERDRARQVIEGLRRRYAGRAFLKPVLWEDLPLQAGLSFQEGIDLVLSAEHGIDVTVFILWSRFGSLQDGSKHRSGTEREFDLMMAAREQSGGTRPAALVYARSDDVSFGERLRGRSTVEQQELLGQKAMVEQFIAEKFKDSSTGRNIRAYHQFDRPVTFTQRLRTHLTELLDEMIGADVADTVWDIERQGPPFMGLEAFQPCHADVFFGREAETMEARHALREQARQGCAFLLLSGASGSGKSSLARAGVLPGIVENELDEQVAAWRTVVTTPLELGVDPLAGLVRCIAADDVLPELRGDAGAMEDLLEGLRRDPALTIRLRMKDAFSRASARASGGVRLLLVLDQMEELFTSAALGESARDEFLNALEAMARSGNVWVLATVRSDFSAQVQAQPALVRMTEGRGVLPLLPPGADALRRLIEQPARMAGLGFERRGEQSLADRILRDASAHAELLPLVEFLLRELHEQRGEGGVLRWEVYEQLGGVEGALAKRAEDVFRAQPAAAQESLGTVLKALVTIGQERGDGSGDEMVRQRVALAEMEREAGAAELVRAMIRERLLVAENDAVTGAATVTIAHESLLRVWPRALAWAANNRDLLRTRARVATRLRDGSPLLDGDPLLDAARAGIAADPASFRPEQREFVEQCARDASLARTRRARLRRRVMAALAVLALASICAAVFAFHKSGEESKARATAQTERQRSDDMLKQVQLQRAEDFFDKGDSSAGIAYLAAVLRRYPADTITASRLLSALRDRSHSRILHGPWSEPDAKLVGWDATGESLILHSKRGILRWNPSDFSSAPNDASAPQPLLQGTRPPCLSGYATLSPTRERILVVHDWNKARIYDTRSGNSVGPMIVNQNGWAGSDHNDFKGLRGVFSQDSRWFIPLITGGPLRVYETETSKAVGQILVAPKAVASAAFSPDGSFLAIGMIDGTLQIRKADGGDWTILREWKEADSSVRDLRFTNTRLLSETAAGLRTHEIKDGAVAEQAPNLGSFACYAVSPNEKMVAIGQPGTSHSVSIVSLESGTEIGAPITCGAYPRSVSFLPNGQSIAISTKFDFRITSIAGTIIQKSRTLPTSPNGNLWLNDESFSISPDGVKICAVLRDGTIAIWATDSSKLRPAVFPITGSASLAALSPTGDTIATAGVDTGALGVWDTEKGSLRHPTFRVEKLGGRVRGVAFRPNKNEVWTSGTTTISPSGQSTWGWDAASGRRLRNRIKPQSHGDWPRFTSDGSRMVANGSTFQVVELPGFHTLPLEAHDLNSRAWLGAMGKGYILDSYRGACVRHDLAGGQSKALFELNGSVIKAIGHDEAALVTTLNNLALRVWDAETGKPLSPVIECPSEIASIELDESTNLVVAACGDYGIRMWRYSSGEVLGSVMRHPNTITANAISPDGRTLASACFDGTLRFWDLPSGRPLSEAVPVLGSSVSQLEWHPDGERVIAAGRAPVQMWPLLRTDVGAPGWLTDWAEAVGGQRLDEKGELHSLPLDAEREFAKRAATITEDDAYARALRWYYEPPDERALSPGHSLTVREWAASLAKVGEFPKDLLAIYQSPQSPAACSSYLWDGDSDGTGLVFSAITRAYFDRVAERAKKSKLDAGLGWLMEAQLHFNQAREKVPDACKEALKAGLEEPWKTRCHVLLVRSLNDAGDARRPELDALLAQPEVLKSLHTHGVNQKDMGGMEKAAETLGTALTFREKTLGADHADTLTTRYAMVEILKHKKDDAGALEALRLVSEGRGRTLGADHEDTIAVLAEYAEALLAQWYRKAAEPFVQRLIAYYEKQHGPDDAYTLHWTKKFANLLKGVGRHAEATPIFQRLIEARIRTEGAEHQVTFGAVQDYADSLGAQRKHAEAEAQYHRALAGREKLLGPEHVDTLWSLSGLAGVIMASGRHADAEPLYRRLFEVRARVFGATNPYTLFTVVYFSECLIHLGKEEEAVLKRLKDALPHLIEKRGENDGATKKAKGFIERLEKKFAPAVPPPPAPLEGAPQ